MTISIRSVEKKFGRYPALNKVDLEIADGELLALLMESAPPSAPDAPDADDSLPTFELGGVPDRRDRPRRTTLPGRAAH